MSGGLDSYTAAAIACEQGFELYALTINYGQRHHRELDAARAVSRALHACQHLEIDVDLRAIGGSALTAAIDVPKGESTAGRSRTTGPVAAEAIPVTYVPARNTVFLSLALAWAETLGAADLFIGVNALDYSGYPDCRPEYLEAFEQLARLATKAGVEGARFQVHAPLIALSKAQIIRRGVSLGLDYALTHSCYDPDPEGRPCGACDSCRLRRKGFEEAGIEDPLSQARF